VSERISDKLPLEFFHELLGMHRGPGGLEMGMDLGKDDVGLADRGGPVPEVPVRDDTRDRILDAAIVVLREVGHGQFSVQKVARHAGVYQGNITYYWPRRRDLVRALAVRVVQDYRHSFLAEVDVSARAPEERAHALVRVMVADAVKPERVRLLPELWSMANADPEIARVVVRCHEEVTDALLESIGAGDGRPCEEEVRRALRLLGVAVQGLTAAHGQRAADDPVLADVTDAVVELHAPLLRAALAGCGD
jgi:AcrR family transcriptional regulator